MKKILITGGAGFIGGHLARSLLSRGNSVAVIDNLTTGAYANIQDLDGQSHFRFYVDGVENSRLMDRLMREYPTVYHLASAVGVRLIIERPVYTIDNIYRSTHEVLSIARRYRNRVLITSTSEVYGKSAEIPFREDGDRLEGPTHLHRWAYAAAKALDEFLALAHYKETKLPVVITRLFNTVGPGQTGQYGMVVPRFIQAALAGEDLIVHGDGGQSRCFCHVLDVVEALIALMESDTCFGEVFNVGATEEITIEQLAQRVIAKVQSASKIRRMEYSVAFGQGFEDMRRRVPDTSKIEKAVGWRTKRSLDDIIDDTIAFERRAASAIPSAENARKVSAK